MKNALVRGGNIDEIIRKHGAIPTIKNEENVVFMFSAEWCPDCLCRPIYARSRREI